MDTRKITLDEISKLIECSYLGKNHTINGLNLSNRKSKYNSILTYANDSKFLLKSILKNNIKGLFLRGKDFKDANLDLNKINCALFFVENPEKEFYNLHEKLFKETKFYGEGVKSKIGINPNIHKSVVVEDGVVIGDNVTIEPFVYIRKGTFIGNNVLIRANSTIGSEGFQTLYDNKIPYCVAHAGSTIIRDNVSIGSNVNICNSLFEGSTIVGENTKIDNLVHIAHNCMIGKNCVLTPGSVLTGSVEIEDNVWVAPGVIVLNKIKVEKKSFLGAASLVVRKVKEGTKVFGIPARKIR